MVGPGDFGLTLCEWGPTSGRATVLLHGFLEQGAAWEVVARGLNRRVAAPDLRGHGRSDAVGPGGWYHFWDYVADVDGLLHEFDAPVDLVGHSMGGLVALLLAATRPARIHKLVAIEGLGPPDTTTHAVDRAIQFLDHRRDVPRHVRLTDLDDAVRRISRGAPKMDRALARELAARITTEDASGSGLQWTWDALHRGRSPTPFSSAQASAFLSRIDAPTLLIDGAETAFQVEDHAQRAAAIPSAGHVVIPGAGHLVHHDAPAALIQALMAFLDAP